MERTSGYILHETRDIVIIAVGFGSHGSENSKTGDVVQIYSLYRWESPVDAIRSGNDSKVCFDCVHRGQDGRRRSCYVNLGQGPLSVWRKYQRGGYPHLAPADYCPVFNGHTVRFGAYGEAVVLPWRKVQAIISAADAYTGYTHQWRRPEYARYRACFMASVDNAEQQAAAAAQSWRTFRVTTPGAPLATAEIRCPAAAESGSKTQCVRCKLCDGRHTGADARKSIVIQVHGAGRGHFIKLMDASGVAAVNHATGATVAPAVATPIGAPIAVQVSGLTENWKAKEARPARG